MVNLSWNTLNVYFMKLFHNFLTYAILILVCLVTLPSYIVLAQENFARPDLQNLFLDTQPQENSPLVPVQPRGGSLSEQQPTVERTGPLGTQISTDAEIDAIKPFGAQLFTKSNFVDKSLGVNASYTIAPGDRIAVKMWGARILETVIAVDVQGNFFLPEVGPIHVEGITNSELTKVVSNRVSKVFTDNVKIYTNLLGSQPIGVYVTGNVKFPGQIPGDRGDSILYFLSRAGGIDEESGSYRNIIVRRNGKTLITVDLYAFMINGDLPDIEFMDKDTIVVGTRLPSVTITGDVRNVFQYEFDPQSKTSNDLISLASPVGTASHALLKGVRGREAISQFLLLDQIRQTKLYPGDFVEVVSDHVTNDITISVLGNSGGPSTMSVRKTALLGQIANLIQTDPLVADINAIYLRRKSVASRQKRAIEQSLYELQRNVLTASSSSSTGSIIRAKEAQLIDRFISKARTVEPEGRIVLSDVNWSGVHMEDGDVIVIPQKTDLVFITGEVKVPQTILWRSGFSTAQYIAQAGGISDRGDGDRLIIIRRNGSVQDGREPIEKGDHIMVLPTLDTKYFAIFKDMIEIVYRVAVSAAVVLNATN
ncbi:MAG: SLBB domain-containing protein [Sneathiella sp.]|nr:SLBB domain-containing protein [Sneathiella sp.]